MWCEGSYPGLSNFPVQTFPSQTLYVPDPEVKDLLKEIRDLLKVLIKHEGSDDGIGWVKRR